MKKIIFVLFAAGLLCACGHAPQATQPESYGDFRDWALTPPMGWNSWDCYGPTVVESEV